MADIHSGQITGAKAFKDTFRRDSEIPPFSSGHPRDYLSCACRCSPPRSCPDPPSLATSCYSDQARTRGGGVEGVRSNPPFHLHKILYSLQLLSVLPFESGPLGSLLLRITTVQTSLVGAMQVVAARKARKVFTPLRLNDARHRNACANKSQVQALETTLDLVPSLGDFDVSRLSKCIAT